MTAAGAEEDRDLVPRWRSFGATLRAGEIEPLALRGHTVNPGDISEQERAYATNPGPFTAADLVSAALVTGTSSTSARDAAHNLIHANFQNDNQVDLAERLLNGDSRTANAESETPEIDFGHIRSRVRRLRRLVRSEPKNAVRWADLALAHTSLGERDSAQREIGVALSLAGPHRFFLRAATRFYVHLGEPDRANALLQLYPDRLDDPWLAAAEIATAELAELPLTGLKRARRLLDNSANFRPRHIAELASQVATTELRAGRTKQAKRLMRLSLVDPTDNAIAQAEWASTHGLDIPVDIERPRTYEAHALRFSRLGDWENAARAGHQWLADQPFAHEAAQFTSYIASVGAMDWPAAEAAARAGLIANPDNDMLRNNLIFAVANQGRITDASDELARLGNYQADPRERAVISATRGMLAFRRGLISQGRSWYANAVAAFDAEKDTDSAALASIFWAREELLAGLDEPDVVTRALDRADRAGSPEAHVWRGRLRELATPDASPS